MATFTSRAVLRKPDTSDNVIVGTDINDNMDQIDQHLGYLVCTSSTRPTGSDRFVGRQIFETDTSNRYIWTNNNEWYLLNELFIQKASDENVASATIQNDNDIVFTLPPGKYIVDVDAIANGHASNDITTTWTFSGTSSATSKHCIGPAGSGNDTENTIVTITGQAMTSTISYALDTDSPANFKEKLIINVTATGDLRFRWAKAVNTVTGTDTTLTTGTIATCRRVA